MAKKETTKVAQKKQSKKTKRRKATGKSNEEVMVDVIKVLRENPDKWQRLQKSLKKCKRDEDRARLLIDFATDERELAALMPLTAGGTEAAAWTTVTVTTVIVLEDTAY